MLNAKFKFISKIASVGTACLLMTACSGVATNATQADTKMMGAKLVSHTHDKTASMSTYTKPGAAVSLSHNYAGHSQVGVPQDIRISLRENFRSGQLTVKILPSDGLDIATSSMDRSFQMSAADDHVMDLTVTANGNGKFLLNFLITADQGVGNFATQSSSLAIFSGTETSSKRETLEIGGEKSTATGGVIVMDAEETIIQ